MKTADQRQVLAAATHLIRCFAAHDRDGYFACFAPEASFIFHTHDSVLKDRAAYQQLWKKWEKEDGFRVLGCVSLTPTVTMLGPIGLFTHQVETKLLMAGQEILAKERETIVFQKDDVGRWLAVHEHLSPMPDA